MSEVRSSQYEWFKGTHKNKKQNFKQQVKTVWKFFKIFLYISLFIFTMFGCVQIFTHKVSNKVGQGVEFYASESEIAPHVTTFDIYKTTDDAIRIYNNLETNTWVNKKEQKHLDNIHKEIATQGKNGKLKLQDAYKGVNEGFRFNFLGKTMKDGVISDGINKVHVDKDSKKPVVGSSEMTYYEGETDSSQYQMFVLQKNNEGNLVWQEIVFSLKATTPQEKFRMNIFKSFFDIKEISDFFKLNPQNKDAKYKKIYNSSWQTIISYVGISPNMIQNNSQKIINPNNGWEFSSNDSSFFPIKVEDSNYIPMLTWSEAWTRGVGPFYGIFVYPIAIFAATIADELPFLDGWETFLTITFVVFFIRAITFLLSFKGTLQQVKMQEMQAKKAIIDAKYAPYKGNKQMENRQKHEIADLYKKEGLSPLGSLATIFLTTPFFLAIWRVIGSLPHIKSTIWLGMNFSATSYKELFAGEFQYLPLMILAASFAAFQQLFPRLLTKRRDKNKINVHQKESMKKNNRTQTIIMVVFVIMSLIFQAGLQVYWIVGGIWMIFQSLITHHVLIRQSKRKKRKRI